MRVELDVSKEHLAAGPWELSWDEPGKLSSDLASKSFEQRLGSAVTSRKYRRSLDIECRRLALLVMLLSSRTMGYSTTSRSARGFCLPSVRREAQAI